MFSGLRQKAIEFGIQTAAGPFFQGVAEGRYGAQLQALYWWLKGRKTIAGFLVALIAAAVAFFAPAEYSQLAPKVAFLGGVLFSAGLLDKNLHADSGSAPSWFTAGLHAIVGAGALIGAIVGAISYFLNPWPMWADRLEILSGAAFLATQWLSTRFTAAPLAPQDREQ